jgi:molecular chaperone DnaK (HSP70)
VALDGIGDELRARLAAPDGSVCLARSVCLRPSEMLLVPLIDAGSALPVVRTELLSTSRDGQTSLSLTLVEGDPSRPAEARVVYSAAVPIARPGPRGTTRIELAISVDARGAARLVLGEHGAPERTEHDLGRLALR